jgi:hypothetical protein
VFQAATYSNRQAEPLPRRENTAVERKWKNKMDTLKREHTRKQQAIEKDVLRR